MGLKFYQKICECAVCGRTPEDGETMYHMGNETWCLACCEKAETRDEPEWEEEKR